MKSSSTLPINPSSRSQLVRAFDPSDGLVGVEGSEGVAVEMSVQGGGVEVHVADR